MENECANEIPEETVVPPVEQPTAQPCQTIPETPPVDRKKVAKKVRLIAILVGVALILALALSATISYFSPGAVAERYAKAQLFSDYHAMNRYCAYDLYAYKLDGDDEEDYFEDISDHYREDIYSWKDYSSYMRDSIEEQLEDYYGDYEISYEATRVKKISLRTLKKEEKSFLDKLENRVDFDPGYINGARKVTVKIKIKGEDRNHKQETSFYMVRIGLSWKVLSADNSLS